MAHGDNGSRLDLIGSTGIIYDKYSHDMALVDDLYEGEVRMRKSTHIIKYEAEKQDSYDRRRKRAPFNPSFKNAVDKNASMPFRQEIVIKGDDGNEQLAKIKDNVDGRGNDLSSWTKNALRNAIKQGVVYALVDFPAFGKNETRLDEIKKGARPTFRLIPRENLFAWSATDGSNGQKELTHIRFYETRITPVGEYGQVENIYIHAWWPDRWEIWKGTINSRKNKTKTNKVIFESIMSGFELEELGNNPKLKKESFGEHDFKTIPLFPWYTKYLDFMEAESALMELARVNVDHFNGASDQENVLKIVRVPQFVMTGLSATEVKYSYDFSTTNALKLRSKEAKVSFAEHSGKGIDAGRQDLVDKENLMAQLGGAPRAQKSDGDVTATKERITEGDRKSDLNDWVSDGEVFLTRLYRAAFAIYGIKLPADFSVNIFNEFELFRGKGEDLKTLLQLYELGGIDTETILEEIKRRQFIASETTVEMMLERLKTEFEAKAKRMELKAAEMSTSDQTRDNKRTGNTNNDPGNTNNKQ